MNCFKYIYKLLSVNVLFIYPFYLPIYWNHVKISYLKMMSGKKIKKPCSFNNFALLFSRVILVICTKYQTCSSLSLYHYNKIAETELLINKRILFLSSEGWNVQD